MAPSFTLQSVLDFRHNRVEKLEVELGQLHLSRQRSQTFLTTLENSRARLFEQIGKTQQGEIDLLLASQLRANLKTVGERITAQQARLSELHEQIRSKQGELIGAKQEEETLNILKRKEVERYQGEQDLQEKLLQDDIYTSQAYRHSLSAA